jgi:predicted phage terminase large subunit-like protein
MNALELALTRRSLARFAQAIDPSYELSPAHRLMIDRLEDLLAGRIKKLAIVAPPRHGKTLLSNVLLPTFALGRDPTERIISVSYGAELSETWGRRARNILNDPDFQKIFPSCRLSPDSAAVYRFETTKNGEYSAVGRGGSVTGKGASLLILDDLLKDQTEASSEAICRSTIEWVRSVALTRLSPEGRVLAVGTRWSEKDALGWLLSQPGWTVLHLPAFAQKDDPLGREVGEALWPSRFPVEALQAIRNDISSRVFSILYQGNPSEALGNVFQRDWFRRFQDPPGNIRRIVQAWDCAVKVHERADYSVGLTVAETEIGYFVLGLVRGRWEFGELKRKVIEQAENWRASEVYIEDSSAGASLIQELKETAVPVIPVKADRDKQVRALRVVGLFESNKVYFPDGASWTIGLEDELAGFPDVVHDDQTDALVMALQRLRGAGDGRLGMIEWLKEFGKSEWLRPRQTVQLPRLPDGVVESNGSAVSLGAGPCGCDPRLHVRISNDHRCNGCGAQWLDSSYRPPRLLSRRDFPAHAGRWN